MITFFAISLVTMNPISAMDTEPVTITNFPTPPVLLFKREATVFLSNSRWTILSYFKLNRFFDEINKIEENLIYLERVCNQNIQKALNCIDVIRRLNLEFKDVQAKSDAFKVSTKRSKRAILNIVGNIASDLFGVLDSRFQEKYRDDMSQIQLNEDHLITLFKNQTSVTETTLGIVKKNFVNCTPSRK